MARGGRADLHAAGLLGLAGRAGPGDRPGGLTGAAPPARATPVGSGSADHRERDLPDPMGRSLRHFRRCRRRVEAALVPFLDR